MKSKLIACILGLSIILSSGTTVLAEAGDASAGSAVQGAEVQPVQPAPAAPAAPAEHAAGGETAPQDPGSAAEGGAAQNPVPADPAQGGTAVNPGSEGTGTEGASSGQNAAGGSSAGSTTGSVPAAEPAEGESVSGTSGSVSGSNAEGTSAEGSSTSEAKAESEAENEDPKKDPEEEKKEVLVTGFSGIPAITVKKKPELKDALAMLPTVVEAILSDGNRIYVPVDWTCASDYNDKKADRFTFASALKKNPDGTSYNIGHPIAPGVRFPTADIVIKADADKTDADKDKNTRKESKDPVTEDKPLVMDDVTAANISAEEGEEKIFLYLMNELGLNRAAACGVLANIHYESGFNPHAVGDGGTSYGICQWHAGRYLSLVSFCDSAKLQYGSVEGQLKYLKQDLENGYRHVFDYLKKIPETEIGAFDAAYYWCYYYERPAMILRQSTLRGNAAKNSYWPRYKEADLEILEKQAEADTVLQKQLVPVMESLSEADKKADAFFDLMDQQYFETPVSEVEEESVAKPAESRKDREPLKAVSVQTEEKAAEPETAVIPAAEEETSPNYFESLKSSSSEEKDETVQGLFVY